MAEKVCADCGKPIEHPVKGPLVKMVLPGRYRTIRYPHWD